MTIPVQVQIYICVQSTGKGFFSCYPPLILYFLFLQTQAGNSLSHTHTHIRARTHTQILHLLPRTGMASAAPAGAVLWVHRVVDIMARYKRKEHVITIIQHFSRHSSTLCFRAS